MAILGVDDFKSKLRGGGARPNLFKATAIVLSIVYVEMLIRKGKPREVVLSKLLQTRAHSAACAVN